MSIVRAIANSNSGLFFSSYGVRMSGIDLARLQEAMDDAGIDQPELARRIGCTQGAISQIVLGKTQRSRFLPDIAEQLGVSLHWLRGTSQDRSPASAPPVSALDAAAELGLTLVPEFDLGYSMGGGTPFEYAERVGVVPFQTNWLRRMISGTFADLLVAKGDGDSMMPTILDEDYVLIDTAQKAINRQDRIWAVNYGELGMIKRIRRLPDGSYELMSDNPQVRSSFAADGEMHVIGRVIWIGRRM